MTNPFEEIAGLYDLMVPWETRLAREKPFYERLFGDPARRILDAACGSGRHAILFASMGHHTSGSDLSEPSIDLARKGAGQHNLAIDFRVEDIRTLTRSFGKDSFDLVTVLGNSLAQFPHEDELRKIFREICEVLIPGGKFIFQIVNFYSDKVRSGRFAPLRTVSVDEGEILFQKFFDFAEDRVTLNLIILIKEKGEWKRRIETAQLRPWKREELEILLEESGFRNPSFYGDFSFSSFDRPTSQDLIIVAQKVPMPFYIEEQMPDLSPG